MNTRNRKLLVIFCFVVLITACSNHPILQSATSDMVVIKAQPEMFVDAYEMAEKECQNYTKNAEYIPDETVDIKIVAFNCVGVEAEEVATETEEAPAETEEAPAETEEGPTETEEAPAETEEVPAETEEAPADS
jgi:hypothetical protein